MREIKFRAWDKTEKVMLHWDFIEDDMLPTVLSYGDFIPMQYTGLKDKNGLQEVYEGDIIDEYGNIKGNIYEMDAGETDFIIQGFGDKNWGATYQNAVDRGCKDSE